MTQSRCGGAVVLLIAALGCGDRRPAPPAEEPRPDEEPETATGCPALPSGARPVIVELASLSNTTCALDSTGAVYCWGNNRGAQAMQSPLEHEEIDVPTRAGRYCFSHIAMGGWVGCGQLLDGKAVCWGDAFGGETGVGNSGGATPQEAIVGIDELTNLVDDVVQVSPGALLQIDGTVWTWGGLARHTWGPAPQPVPGLMATALPTDGQGYCALDDEERVVCYGLNSSGRAGRRPGKEPVTVAGDVLSLPGPADEVVTGHGKVCARLKSGDVYCWGDGPPGNGEEETLGVAVKVLHVENAISVGVGTHACAVDGDGAVWCWGHNYTGESGLPWWTYVYSPVRVDSVPPAIQVVAGGAHTCALTVDHEVYCWGSNLDGALGIGRDEPSTHIPQRVDIPIETP